MSHPPPKATRERLRRKVLEALAAAEEVRGDQDAPLTVRSGAELAIGVFLSVLKQKSIGGEGS